MSSVCNSSLSFNPMKWLRQLFSIHSLHRPIHDPESPIFQHASFDKYAGLITTFTLSILAVSPLPDWLPFPVPAVQLGGRALVRCIYVYTYTYLPHSLTALWWSSFDICSVCGCDL